MKIQENNQSQVNKNIMIKSSILIMVFSIFAIVSFAQTISIADARQKSVGSSVSIQGIITNGDELGVIRYIQDNTGGVAIYDANLIGLKRGDEVSLTGVLTDYNELLEISSVSTHKVISSNNPLPNPKKVNFTDGFKEAYESQLVTFDEITFTETGSFKGNVNYEINQKGVKKEVRISKTSNIVTSQIPENPITIVGIMSQYKTTYQLLPRDLGDLNFLNAIVKPIEIKTNSLTLYFETQNNCTTIFEYGTTENLELGLVKDENFVKQHTLEISGLQPTTFYFVKAKSVNTSGDTLASGLYYFSTASLSSGKITTYFNKTVDQNYAVESKAVFLNRLIDDTLVAYIDRAKESIDICVYNLNNSGLSANISNALNNAATRGVIVRAIGDGSTANAGFDDLSGGVYRFMSPQGANYSIMHNKFLIIDADHSNPDVPIVWTGSTNLTDGQIHSDPNNVIIIQDQALAKAYQLEFNEMWGSSNTSPSSVKSRFGQFKSDNTPHYFNVGGKMVELYFSPSDNTTQQLINAINTADASIYFALYVFTRTEIAYPMIDRYNDGVYIAGIFDDIATPDAYNVLKTGIGDDILVYNGSGIFHHKYAIIDYGNISFDADPLVITGSHNWSSTANTKNDENTLIIHDEDLAGLYFQEWAQRFKDNGGTVFVGLEDEVGKEINEEKANFVILNQTIRGSVTSNSDAASLFEVYSISGKLIFQKQINLKQGTNQLNFQLPELSGSVYLIRTFLNGETFTQKLLKL